MTQVIISNFSQVFSLNGTSEICINLTGFFLSKYIESFENCVSDETNSSSEKIEKFKLTILVPNNQAMIIYLRTLYD